MRYYRALRKMRGLKALEKRGPKEKYPFYTMQVSEAFMFGVSVRTMQTIVCRKNKLCAPRRFKVHKDPYKNYTVVRII